MAREHARAFADVPGVTLAGIHSRTRARAEALAGEFGIEAVCGTVDELREKSAADLVVVAVPVLVTAELATACMAHSWTVLLEKPAGLDIVEARAIARAAGTAEARMFVALNRRFFNATRTALKDLSGSDQLRVIHVQDQQDPAQAHAQGQPERVVENWMYANSVHLVDYFTVFGRGEVTDVRIIEPWRGEDTAVVLASVSFESGDRGLYEGIWSGPGPWAVSVTTPDRRWEMRPLELASCQISGEGTRREMAPDAWDRDFKPGLRRQAQMAVRAATGQDTDLPDLAQSLRTMELIGAIFTAPRT